MNAALLILMFAQPVSQVYLTGGVGTSHPYRPGNPSAATELGIEADYRDFGLSIRFHSEGDGALAGQGTASLGRVGIVYAPTFEQRPGQMLRAEVSTFLLVDLIPAQGYGLDVTYGARNHIGSLGAFAAYQTDWYSSWRADNGSMLAGFTTGIEAQAFWRFAFTRVRLGTIGGSHPYVLATVGIGYAWN